MTRDNQTRQLNVFMTANEYETIAKVSDSIGLGVATFLRVSALNSARKILKNEEEIYGIKTE